MCVDHIIRDERDVCDAESAVIATRHLSSDPVSSDYIQHRSDVVPNAVSTVVNPELCVGVVDVEAVTLSAHILDPTASCCSSDPVKISDMIYGEDMLTTSQQSSDPVLDVVTDMNDGKQRLCDLNVAILALSSHSSGPTTSCDTPDPVRNVEVCNRICDDETLPVTQRSPDPVPNVVSDTICDDETLSVCQRRPDPIRNVSDTICDNETLPVTQCSPDPVRNVVSDTICDDETLSVCQRRPDPIRNVSDTICDIETLPVTQHSQDPVRNVVSDTICDDETLSVCQRRPDPIRNVSDTICDNETLLVTQSSPDPVRNVVSDTICDDETLSVCQRRPDPIRNVSDTISGDEMLSISGNCSNNIATRSDRMDLTGFKPPEKRKQRCNYNDEPIATKCFKSMDGLSGVETYDRELSSVCSTSVESAESSLAFNSASCLTTSTSVDVPDVEMIANIVADDDTCQKALYRDVLSKLTASGLPDETTISIPIGTLIFILNSGTYKQLLYYCEHC